jgi:hypothetical protein
LFVFGLLWLKNGYFAANLQTSGSISLLSVFFAVPKNSEILRRGRQNLSEALCEKLYVFSNLPLFENHPQFHLTDRCSAPQSFVKSENCSGLRL